MTKYDSMNRRRLLTSLASASTVSLLADRIADAATKPVSDKKTSDSNEKKTEARNQQPKGRLHSARIDTNVTLFKWPFRNLPLDSTETLQTKLIALGISQAWAGTFEGIFQRDITSVNNRLSHRCKKYPFFVPMGSVNPSLPGWKKDLQRCVRQHRMSGIRLHPNYHSYSLESTALKEIMKVAAAENIVVQIATTMEDTRTQNRLVAVPDVNLTHLATILEKYTEVKIQLLNLRPKSEQVPFVEAAPNLYFDTCRIDATDGLKRFLERIPASRVLYGSNAPLLIPEASMIRIYESNLPENARKKILNENAKRLIGRDTESNLVEETE